MRFTVYLPISTLITLIFFCGNTCAQDVNNGYVFHPDQDVRVVSLPAIVATSKSESDVMAASVATAVMGPDVCCGRNSALEDEVPSDGKSLKELGQKLRGKHYLASGQTIVVADQYWSGASVNSGNIVGSLMAQHPLLMNWEGHVYVLYGAVFDEYKYYDGTATWVIKKLSLVDTRYSDKRRYVSFDRQTDDWTKVTGILALTITR
jgi:hypothetical protein